MEKFKLEKTIELGKKVIISDPAYNNHWNKNFIY